MAVLTRGTTISATTTVTSQTLHDLIELAQVGTITPSDIEGAVSFIRVSRAVAPNPTSYPFWYDSNPEDPMFKVYAQPWGAWIGLGPHRIEVPMINGANTSLRHGCLVVAHSSPSMFTIGTNPSLNAIGFIQSSAASGAAVGVGIKGIGYALFCSAVSGAFAAIVASQVVAARNVLAGCVMGYSFQLGSNMSGPNFGVWVEGDRSGFSGTFDAGRILIWGGGRVSHQFGSF